MYRADHVQIVVFAGPTDTNEHGPASVRPFKGLSFMRLTIGKPGLRVALFLGLAAQAALQAPGYAQVMSGSGNANMGTGAESGAGPGQIGTGTESGSNNSIPNLDSFRDLNGGQPPRYNPSEAIPYGSGIGSTLPGDGLLIPLDALFTPGESGNNQTASTVSAVHLKYAKSIPIPGERSLALSRVAGAAIFSGQLKIADEALTASADAARLMTPGLVRDQRLISIITALMSLAEANLREGKTDAAVPVEETDPKAPAKVDRSTLIRRAKAEWERAGDLVTLISNPTYLNEMVYRVAENIAYGSQTILLDFPTSEGENTSDKSGLNTSFSGLPDALLVQAAQLAEKATRPVWHDRALVAIASAAAESKQFTRAVNVAGQIPQPEVRSDAYLKIAMTQSRYRDFNGATKSFSLAAKSVASIPLDDPRVILAGVLIDSLVSVGRFDDAIASVGLYPTEPKKWIALGAIAESQGRRGEARAALAWINRDVPAAQRSLLYRRVSNGVVTSIEQNRNKANTSDLGIGR